jgi:hypothetical protein
LCSSASALPQVQSDAGSPIQEAGADSNILDKNAADIARNPFLEGADQERARLGGAFGPTLPSYI